MSQERKNVEQRAVVLPKRMAGETVGFRECKIPKKVTAVTWTVLRVPTMALRASTGLFSCVGLHVVLEA